MQPKSIVEIFSDNCRRFASRPCFQFKKKESWATLSWSEAFQRVKESSLGLSGLGISRGDAVVIFSSTSMEWTLCDLAILSIGAVTVPVYQSSTPEQLAYIVNDSEAKVLFVEGEAQLKKAQAVLSQMPKVQKIILMKSSPSSSEGAAITFAELVRQGKGQDSSQWEKGKKTLSLSDTATIVYTSGTTGNPKGAILTHGNIVAEVEACGEILDLSPTDTGLCFLPLAHIVARAIQFFQLKAGFVHIYAESIDKLIENIAQTKPNFIVSVPRIFEKVYERVQAQVQAGSALKKGIFAWGISIGREVSRLLQQRQKIPFTLKLQYQIAKALIFSKIQQKLGGRLRFAISGGAPLSKEIAEFFHAIGLLILEGYGLTETTAAVNCNTPQNYRFGTVGRPALGIEEKIAADGEILVRGPMVFKGYFKKPEATAEVLDGEGWFRTGDIGLIDPNGYLTITDRKKDIIVTASGKNIAPQNIEGLFKTDPYISQVVIHGDRRKYLSALVVLNKTGVERFATEQGIPYHDFHELIQNPLVYNLVKRSIDEKNKDLASYETVKRFAILENDFTQETGELTPTLKVKRKFVSEKYREVLDRLYQDAEY